MATKRKNPNATEPIPTYPFPTPTPVSTPKQELTKPTEIKPKQGDLVTDETGRVTGFINSSGNFVPTSPQIAQQLAAHKATTREIPAGVNTASQAAQAQQLQQTQFQQAAANQQLIQNTQLSQPQQFGEDNLLESAALAGAGKMVTSGPLVGAGIGAAIGGAAGLLGGPAAVGTVPAGAVYGAAAGSAVGAFISGFTTKLKTERQEKIAVEYRDVPNSIKSMNQLIAYVNKGGPEKEEAWKQFQDNLISIDQAQIDLKIESDNILNKFLSVDTSREMGYIESFNQNLRGNYVARMQMAMIKPDPNADQIDMSSWDISETTGDNLIG